MKNNYTSFKTGLLLFVFSGWCTLAFSQAATWMWDESFGGNKSEYVGGTCRDANGSIYVTGNMQSQSFNFGSVTVTDTFLRTFYLAKLNSGGQTIWAKTFGGYAGDTFYISPGPTGIVNDAAGNIYMVGSFETDTLKIGAYTLTKTDTGSPNTSVFVAEYDPNGNVLWAESLGGNTNAYATGIALDASNNIYITGRFNSDSLTAGNITLINTGNNNVFTIKLSSTGQVVWATSPTASNINVTSNAIVTTPDGGVCITGWVQGDTAVFGNYVISNPLYAALIFVTRYDTAGNVVWAISAGDSSYQYGYSIAADAQSNLYITGSFNARHLAFGNTVLTNDSFGDGGDVFLAKLNPQGSFQWAIQGGGKGEDLGYSVAVDNADYVYLTGYFWSRPFVLGTDTFDKAGSNGSALFAAKFDNSGNQIWTEFGYSYQSITSQVIVPDNDGNAYVTGYFGSTYMYFDSSELINAGITGLTTDIFVAKVGNGPSAIRPVNAPAGLTVYPNPSGGRLNIDGLQPGNTICLYDLTGRLLTRQIAGSAMLSIDLSWYTPGMYMLQTPVGVVKIIKQ